MNIKADIKIKVNHNELDRYNRKYAKGYERITERKKINAELIWNVFGKNTKLLLPHLS